LICPEDFVDYSQDPPAVVYQKGAYNPYNRWNTTDGIMHLCQPNNTISAEIQLAADATVLYHKNGRPVVIPDELVCCAAYGGAAPRSDPPLRGRRDPPAPPRFSLPPPHPPRPYMND